MLKRLSESELDVMLVVWRAQEALDTGEVARRLQKGWKIQAVQVVLGRLVKKGYLSCEKIGRLNYYTPLVAEADYRAAETETFGKAVPEFPEIPDCSAGTIPAPEQGGFGGNSGVAGSRGGIGVLESICFRVLRLSLQMSILLLLSFLGNKWLTRRFAAQARCFLWMAFSIRLLIPASLSFALPSWGAEIQKATEAALRHRLDRQRRRRLWMCFPWVPPQDSRPQLRFLMDRYPQGRALRCSG